jgi:Phage stabilisation protein
MRFVGFIGPSYTMRSVNIDCQRCVNLYPEMDELHTSKEQEVGLLVSTPGLRNILELGDGPIRCVHVAPNDDIFVISGNKAYKVSNTAGVWSSTLLSVSGPTTLETTTGPVIATSTSQYTIFADGAMNCVYDLNGGSPYFGRFDGLGFPGVPTATHVTYIDGYVLFNESGTSKFYVSDLNNPLTVSALDFSSAEGDPDSLVAILANTRDLWLFGQKSIEMYVNTGNADFPFERVSGGFVEQGCLAAYSPAKINGFVFWLGRGEHGQGAVYMAKGLAPQRISNHAIETAISGYADPSDAVAYTYQSEGHFFYSLSFAEATWVYDVATGLWHERAFTNTVEGTLERHLSQFHAYYSPTNEHLVGDYEQNKIYVMEHGTYTDDDEPITRLRASLHQSSELKRLFCNSFQLDMEVGVGLDGNDQGSDPQVMLQWSDDGGHTWSNEHWKSIGAIGEYKKRVIWRRLGQFRDRVWRVKITDPVNVNLLGAEVDLQKGGG